MVKPKICVAVILCLIAQSPSFGQKVIHGTIKNSETGEVLPYANIQVEGTYKGTISNEDGEYTLTLKILPATILVRYIGYVSKRITINDHSPEHQNIFLEPTVIEMEPVIVTAEDPAVSIMREVIRRKQIWYKKLKTYEAKAYTRLALENDTSIVFISESTSKIYWGVNRGAREVIKSKRETANIQSEQIFAYSSYLPNFYDDDIEIQGTRVIGPTHPDALKYYNFKLVEERAMDDKLVFDISVQPKTKLQPTFEGRISVLDEEYAMIDVNLKPSSSVIMPFPIKDWNVYHRQQFSNFGQEFWLPVDARIKGDVKISMPGIHFPRITYNQLSRITNYDVNVVLPDSLYEDNDVFTVDSISVRQDTFLIANSDIIPLTDRENHAYQTIDSTMTLEKAFQPTGFIAWLARLRVDTDEEDKPEETTTEKSNPANNNKGNGINLLTGISPQFMYNRVDAFHLGAKYKRSLTKRLFLHAQGAYKTGLKRWSYGGGFRYFTNKHKNMSFSLRYASDTDTRYDSNNYPIFYNSAMNLLGFEDYFDYYWNKKFIAEMSHRIRTIRSEFTVGFRNESHSSVKKSTDYDLFGRELIQRPNPRIQEGRLRSVTFKLEIGDEWVPWGIVGQTGAEFEIEHSSPDILSSDFSFTRYELSCHWRLETYLKRRLLPNVLDLRLIAGTATGDLPVQRFGSLDVRSGAFSPFGVFRTRGNTPYEGEKYAALFWEHNFRTVPFELLGIESLVKNGVSFIVHGASGRTWISQSKREKLNYSPQYLNDFYHELGFSISGLYGFLRIDVTTELQGKGTYMGFGLARIF